MGNSKIITDSDFKNYITGNSKALMVEAFINWQIDNWELAKHNYIGLEAIKKKEFHFDGFNLQLQFNPGRIVSTSAKIDAKSIGERPCFLCSSNLPKEQKALLCDTNYLLLVNPFPIFEQHFTIPHFNHIPQEIFSSFGDMLLIAKELGEKYTLFYNGPQCGASAPDHLHFQASPKNAIPIEKQTGFLLKNSEVIYNSESVLIYAVKNYLRNLFLIESNNIFAAQEEFNKLYNSLKEITNFHLEPLINVLVTFDKTWRVYLFPRKAHRPKEFFFEGDEKILISPATVDFGGLLITPRQEDFDKITKETIINIFEQTSIDDTIFENIIKNYSL